MAVEEELLAELALPVELDIVEAEDGGGAELHESGDESSTFLVNSEMSASRYVLMNGRSSS